MVEEFTYRGKTAKELQEMNLEEFAKLLPSKERRALKRSLSEEKIKFIKHIRETKGSTTYKPIRTHVRDMIILPEMVGTNIGVHNGREFKVIAITEEMLGHRLGEFSSTRVPPKHSAPGVGATRSSSHIALK